ncbi:MAG: class I SAM-dependent methyltransferase [Actinobacteria bacterium]|nr:class I SAM-dependent methyltransferase [Actinomycetota bacterium]
MEPTEHNRRAWDEIHRKRAEVLGGERGLPSQVRHAFADLKGKRVLDLQCGTGESTAELAELGAIVTGVDSSGQALEAARERWPSILWVQADPQELPAELRRGRFDLVYAGLGSLLQLSDLDPWMREIAAALRSGGELLLFEEHPVALCVDGLMHWRESYFDEGSRRLGQIVNAAARAGLLLRALEEYPSGSDGFRRHDARVPGTFLLYSRKA